MKANFTDIEKKADEFDLERESLAKLSLQVEQQQAAAKNTEESNPALLSSKFLVKDPQAFKAKEVRF